MFEKLCDNLNTLMREHSVNASDLARRIGLPASTIKKIRNRDNPNPTLSTLLPIAEFFSLTLSQLIGHEPLSSEMKKNIQVIPKITWEEAIKWPNVINENRSFLTIEKKFNEQSYALSMLDDLAFLAKDTLLIVDPVMKPSHKDYVIVHKENQKLPSLREYYIDEEIIYLKPLVNGLQISHLEPTHKILGVMVEYRKQIK